MPVTNEEREEYRTFAKKIAIDFGCLESPKGLIWHYTDGEGLTSILQSGCLHASQIAALNDKNETRFGSKLYREAIEKLLSEHSGDSEVDSFLNYVLEQVREDPDNPSHGKQHFVCVLL